MRLIWQNQTYLYLIGKNDEVKEVNLLFPNADSSSEYMGANTKFLLPNPQWNPAIGRWEEMHYQLIPPTGKEYWFFLFSKNKLNIKSYISQLQKTSGNFNERILSVFGKELVPENQINYLNKKIGFSLSTGHTGSIVPLLIDFEHVSQNRNGFLQFN